MKGMAMTIKKPRKKKSYREQIKGLQEKLNKKLNEKKLKEERKIIK
jgi:hypothetical protein